MSIDSLPATRRIGAWRDAVCSTFVRLECQPHARTPLHGRIDSTVHGDLHVARVQSSPQHVERTRALAGSATDAYVLLSVQLRGRTLVRQGGREAMLEPGCIAFYDTSRPYTLDLPEDFDQIVLHLPHAALVQDLPAGLDGMALRLGAADPFAQALVAIAPQLLRLAGSGRADVAARAATTARDLMALALDTLTSPAEPGTAPAGQVSCSGTADALVWRTRAAMSRRLADPDLAPAMLAAEVGVSLRRVQEAFRQRGGSVAEALWEMRLELARSLLLAPARWPIATVAERAGFRDAAHFSRRFRQQYASSPREYRSEAAAGLLAPQPSGTSAAPSQGPRK